VSGCNNDEMLSRFNINVRWVVNVSSRLSCFHRRRDSMRPCPDTRDGSISLPNPEAHYYDLSFTIATRIANALVKQPNTHT